MYLIIFGALILAIGVGLIAVPAGVIVLGIEVIAAGAYRDLLTEDEEPET